LIPHKSILFAYGYSVYFVDENSAVKRDVISELIVHNFDAIFRLISYMDDVHRLCQICHRALPVNLGEQITETVKLVLFVKFTVEFDWVKGKSRLLRRCVCQSRNIEHILLKHRLRN